MTNSPLPDKNNLPSSEVFARMQNASSLEEYRNLFEKYWGCRKEERSVPFRAPEPGPDGPVPRSGTTEVPGSGREATSGAGTENLP